MNIMNESNLKYNIIDFCKKNNITNNNTLFLYNNYNLTLFNNNINIGGFCGLPNIDNSLFNNHKNKNIFIFLTQTKNNDLNYLVEYLKDDTYVDNFDLRQNDINYLVKKIHERNDRNNKYNIIDEVYNINKEYILEITRGLNNIIIFGAIIDNNKYKINDFIFNNKQLSLNKYNNTMYLFLIILLLYLFKKTNLYYYVTNKLSLKL